MSRRITKEVAMELIPFVKKLEIHANIYNPNSVVAYGMT